MNGRHRLLIFIWAFFLSGLVFLISSSPVVHTDSIKSALAVSDQATITRPQDPVIIQGADLTAFLNKPISDLRLYRYGDSGWMAIPFQVDEVNQDGDIVSPGQDDDDSGQSLLDANDQLVFMGHDSGQDASCADSIKLIGGGHDREAITVDDSLLGESGKAYLLNSTSIPTSASTYIEWNESTQTITGTYGNSYSAKFGVGSLGFLISDLYVNGSGDVLDRQKINLRLGADLDISGGSCSVTLPVSCTFTEEGSTDLTCDLIWDRVWEQFSTTSAHFLTAGPVRAVTEFGVAAFYGSRSDLNLYLPFELVEQWPICPDTLEVDRLRGTLDLNNPAGHGINAYYDSNDSMTTVDGNPDNVPETPSIDWYQVSGGDAGGLVVALRDIELGTGSASTYYLDDSAAGGTGDGSSYGEAGIQIIGSQATYLGESLTFYILPPQTNTDVGAMYFEYATTPLTATTESETCKASYIYLPITQRD